MLSKLESMLSPVFVDLLDTSGGCGSFYRLFIVSPSFTGQSLVAQHKLVKEALKEEIAGIHGITINTETVEKYQLSLNKNNNQNKHKT